MGLRLRDINSGRPLFYVYEYLYSVLTCTVTTEYEGSNIPNHSLRSAVPIFGNANNAS